MENREITSLLLLLHRKVSKDLNKHQLCQKLVRIIKELVKCDGCAILFVENGNIEVLAEQGYKKTLSSLKISLSSSKPIKHILKTGKSILIEDVDKSNFKGYFPKGFSRNSYLCVPVRVNGKISGIIYLDSLKKNAFGKEDLNLVNLISSELSSILERSLLYSKIEESSIRDPLTGYFNRRSLFYDLTKKIEECKRYKKTFSVMMIDIDNFKKYNDRFGHSRGDSLLKTICKRLRKSLRKADILYRYGGDEFVVLLPETNKEGAKVCSQRLEEHIEKMNKRVDSKTKITISTGVAQYPDDGLTPVSLIKVADKMMYKNKFLKKSQLTT